MSNIEPPDDDACPACGETHDTDSRHALDTASLYALAERDDVPADVREQIVLAAAALDVIVNRLVDQGESISTLRLLIACLIFEQGGCIHVARKTMAACPFDIMIERTEPYDKDGYNYKVNVTRWHLEEGSR